MNAKLYKIKCLTNMHVGNGDVNFNIIDNEVERDPITGYPTINASGVKGALRKHFEECNRSADEIGTIFGKANTKDTDMCAGNVKFFCANMLAVPMRVSKGNSPYVLVTTSTAIEQLKTLCGALGVAMGEIETASTASVYAEDIECTQKVNIFGEDMYIMDGESFKKVPLPVMARNCLQPENPNLWYEEIVPHETVMYFFAVSADDTVDTFNGVLKNNGVVQFGGNASIGYGVCKVEEISHE